MTKQDREFAKSRIEYLLKISSFVFDEHDKEALEAAIQALSQEPTKREIEREYLFQSLCEDFKKLQAENDDLRKRLEQEPCDDAISREYLKKIAQSEGAYGYVSAYDIATAPPVTPSRRKGHWIRIEEKYGYHYKCSKCGYESEIPTAMGKLVWKGCPYCLAEMVEPQESEEQTE